MEAKDVLLSVRPCFASKIRSGEKKFEYRKSIFRYPCIRRIYVYESQAVKRITGYFLYSGFLCDTAANIWQLTQEFSGVSKDFYDRYFSLKKTAYAINITDFVTLAEPVHPFLLDPKFIAPQSFRYLKEGDLQ